MSSMLLLRQKFFRSSARVFRTRRTTAQHQQHNKASLRSKDVCDTPVRNSRDACASSGACTVVWPASARLDLDNCINIVVVVVVVNIFRLRRVCVVGGTRARVGGCGRRTERPSADSGTRTQRACDVRVADRPACVGGASAPAALRRRLGARRERFGQRACRGQSQLAQRQRHSLLASERRGLFCVCDNDACFVLFIFLVSFFFLLPSFISFFFFVSLFVCFLASYLF